MMRSIKDATGTQWTVFEVKKQGAPGDRWTYLPTEYGNGWLCFESGNSKKRLTPVPEHWREATDEELRRMLAQAQAVNRPNFTIDDQPNA